jgi:hypothetical protein
LTSGVFGLVSGVDILSSGVYSEIAGLASFSTLGVSDLI